MTTPAPRPAPLPPIRKRISVPLSPQDAFRLFTEGLDRWWPVETHSLSAGRGGLPRAVRVEPRNGGHIVETTDSGEESRWGTITEWRPGERLRFDWYVGRTREEATEVTVTFAPDGDDTQVDLVHGGWNRMGETATTSRKSYGPGWNIVLARYLETARVAPTVAQANPVG